LGDVGADPVRSLFELLRFIRWLIGAAGLPAGTHILEIRLVHVTVRGLFLAVIEEKLLAYQRRLRYPQLSHVHRDS
jgi:hypothetical protein